MRTSRGHRGGIGPTAVAGAMILAAGCLTPTQEVSPGDSLATTIPPGGGDDGGPFDSTDGGPFSPDAGPGCPPEAPLPDFGTPTHCDRSPPPVSGGTLLVTRDGKTVVAADPDRDAVYIVDLASKTLLSTVALQTGDEPGRLVEDGAGLIHAALRSGGAVATIDPASGIVIDRASVCPAPRGIAWQASTDTLWVACATGELASLPASGGPVTLTHVDRDLRDVIVDGDTIAVTRFRSAEVLRLDADRTVSRRDPLPASSERFASHVAWRSVQGSPGSIVSVHQQESLQSLQTGVSGGYGCGRGFGPGISLPPFVEGPFALDASGPDARLPNIQGFASNDPVGAVLSVLGSDGGLVWNASFAAVLPVDVAVSHDGSILAVVSAGNATPSATSGVTSQTNLFVFQPDSASAESGTATVGMAPPIAVAFAPDDSLLLQTREPAELLFATSPSNGMSLVARISLSAVRREDTGHTIFHTHAGSEIACASCHPEGGDDGHVWLLDGEKRRTPSLRGTIAGTAPYHWPGDQKDFTALVHDVYQTRMNGGSLADDQLSALSRWVDAIPAPPAPTWVDPAAAAAGRALFRRADIGCRTCHSGPKFTNNATVDVGTGGAFQVPPLTGVGWRTPLLHDGCASTIGDRFGSCATKAHGNTAALSSRDIANLTAYLETL